MDINDLVSSLDKDVKVDKDKMIEAMENYASSLKNELIKNIKVSYKSQTGETHVIWDVTVDHGIDGIDWEIKNGDVLNVKDVIERIMTSTLKALREN